MNKITKNLLKKYFHVENNTLFVRGKSILNIVKQYQTPFYLYDSGIQKKKLDLVRKCFPFCDVYYSVKANPNHQVISFFVNNNCGTEIASLGEFEKSILAGNSASKIIYAGPGKRTIDLYTTVEKNIAEIHLESFSEIKRCNECAKELDKIQSVSIRINPANQFQTGAIQMGGKPVAFGFDEELLDDAVNAVKDSKNLRLSGLHIYAGTQILDFGAASILYEHALNLCEVILNKHYIPIETLDLGGGFGVPYYEEEEELNIEELGRALKTAYDRLIKREKSLLNLKVIFEPGRFLTAESGIYVTTVIAVKQSRNKLFAICDGGMNHHLAASGNLGQIIKKNFPIICANKVNLPEEHNYELCGPLCTPLDSIGRNIKMPKLDEGDIVVILNSGAYGLSASPTNFLSHEIAKEIFID